MMPPPDEESNLNERTRLLNSNAVHDRRASDILIGQVVPKISSHLSKEEQLLGSTAIGERLPYNDYTTIDWLHDLVLHSKDSISYSTG